MQAPFAASAQGTFLARSRRPRLTHHDLWSRHDSYHGESAPKARRSVDRETRAADSLQAARRRAHRDRPSRRATSSRRSDSARVLPRLTNTGSGDIPEHWPRRAHWCLTPGDRRQHADRRLGVRHLGEPTQRSIVRVHSRTLAQASVRAAASHRDSVRCLAPTRAPTRNPEDVSRVRLPQGLCTNRYRLVMAPGTVLRGTGSGHIAELRPTRANWCLTPKVSDTPCRRRCWLGRRLRPEAVDSVARSYRRKSSTARDRKKGAHGGNMVSPVSVRSGS